MRVLVDTQTFNTTEANRGIGICVDEVIKRLPSVICCDSPRILQNCGGQVFWNPNPLMWNVDFITDIDLPRVITIWDIIPFRLKEQYLDTFPQHIREEYLRRFHLIPKWANYLVFESEHARQDYAREYPEILDRSSVVYWGVDHNRFKPLYDGYMNPLKNRSILLVGGFDYRKNMDSALKGFAYYNQVYDPHSRLAVLCDYTPKQKSEYIILAQQLGVSEQLDFYGHIPYEKLHLYYQHAECTLFPSLYEGFGRPILESLACGVPVVAGRNTSQIEVGGNAAYYCDPTNPENIGEQIHKAINFKNIDKMQRQAAKFTWEKTIEQYLKIFERISK